MTTEMISVEDLWAQAEQEILEKYATEVHDAYLRRGSDLGISGEILEAALQEKAQKAENVGAASPEGQFRNFRTWSEGEASEGEASGEGNLEKAETIQEVVSIAGTLPLLSDSRLPVAYRITLATEVVKGIWGAQSAQLRATKAITKAYASEHLQLMGQLVLRRAAPDLDITSEALLHSWEKNADKIRSDTPTSKVSRFIVLFLDEKARQDSVNR